MASSSHNNLEREFDESFDQYFDQYFDQAFDQAFENLYNNHGGQEDERRTRKFLSKEIVKKAISGYGMIISVTLQHVLKIYSDGDLE